MPEGDDRGLSGAHTRADPAGEAGDRDQGGGKKPAGAGEIDQAQLADAIRQLSGELEAAPEQFDLLAEDLQPVDTLGLAGEIVARRQRDRGAGRPPGASNKRNTAVFDYLEALGHRDPATTLSLLQTADTKELAQMLGCDPLDVLREQVKAAINLMPFKYAKKPTELQVSGGAGSGRPVMVIGEMNVAIGMASDDGFMSAGQPRAKTVEHQEVSDEASVRHDGDAPHETAKTLKTKDD